MSYTFARARDKRKNYSQIVTTKPYDMKNWTKEQDDIIKSNQKLIKIQAPAGYGKTYTLIHKCIWHLQQSSDNLKILYIVFNENIKNNIKKDITKHFRENFGKYRAKNMLSCINIQTTYELARNIVKNKIGHFELIEFSDVDVKNYLYANIGVKYSDDDIKIILKKLEHYYNSLESITNQLQEEIQDCFDENTQKHIAYIYQGVIAIIQAQMKLEFHISKASCLKLSYCLDMDNIFYDIAIIDEAQDTNIFIYGLFMDLKSNIKLITGDRFSNIFANDKSYNIFAMLDDFTKYDLSSSFRLANKTCDIANKIIKKIHKTKTIIIGQDIPLVTDKNKIQEHHITQIHNNKANMLRQMYKSVLENKKIYIIGSFIEEYKEFLAMCYVASDFNKEFLGLSFDIKVISDEFLRFESLNNYIEITENKVHREYFTLMQEWLKAQDSLVDRINLIKSHYVEKPSLADISYVLVKNTKALEFDYVIVANDFIDYTTTHNPNEDEKEELKLLYMAITRCRFGLYMQSLR